MKIGSDEHKELFCRWFIGSHLAYEPAELPWPALDDRSVEFLHAVPVWPSALEVEVNAGAMLDEFASTQQDPLICEALALQGYEEARHGRMLRTLFDRYGIEVPDVKPSPQSSKAAFISFGYDECLDSFFGFGIFRIAKEAKVVADSLINVFARVLIEEARHIVFFVNWVAYDRARRGLGAAPLQALPTARGYLQALLKTIRRGKSANADERGMGVALDVFAGLTLERFLLTCLEENDRYMAAFDTRLLRPKFVPTLVRCALRVLPRRARLSAVAGESAP
ncbi:MAG TPA: ferritin-like domain-containing protein [Candidatus Baltobacteraceae bacterium]|nr:ferritin-like domain-containing protein [Candidatus Baltobacteraceae bacterium]